MNLIVKVFSLYDPVIISGFFYVALFTVGP